VAPNDSLPVSRLPVPSNPFPADVNISADPFISPTYIQRDFRHNDTPVHPPSRYTSTNVLAHPVHVQPVRPTPSYPVNPIPINAPPHRANRAIGDPSAVHLHGRPTYLVNNPQETPATPYQRNHPVVGLVQHSPQVFAGPPPPPQSQYPPPYVTHRPDPRPPPAPPAVSHNPQAQPPTTTQVADDPEVIDLDGDWEPSSDDLEGLDDLLNVLNSGSKIRVSLFIFTRSANLLINARLQFSSPQPAFTESHHEKRRPQTSHDNHEPMESDTESQQGSRVISKSPGWKEVYKFARDMLLAWILFRKGFPPPTRLRDEALECYNQAVLRYNMSHPTKRLRSVEGEPSVLLGGMKLTI